jgi:hypothetical protein
VSRLTLSGLFSLPAGHSGSYVPGEILQPLSRYFQPSSIHLRLMRRAFIKSINVIARRAFCARQSNPQTMKGIASGLKEHPALAMTDHLNFVKLLCENPGLIRRVFAKSRLLILCHCLRHPGLFARAGTCRPGTLRRRQPNMDRPIKTMTEMKDGKLLGVYGI